MAINELFKSRHIHETVNGIREDCEYMVDQGDPRLILNMAATPKIGDAHPTWPDLRVTERDIEVLSASLCRLTLLYSREGYQTGTEEQEEEEVEMAAEQGLVMYDAEGEALYDAEQQRFGVEGYIPRGVLVFTRWRSFVDIELIFDYVAAINNEPWKGYDPGTLLFLGVVSTRTGHTKWRLTYRFLFNPDGHNLTRGKMECIEKDTGKKDTDGDPITKWVWEPIMEDGKPVMELILLYTGKDFRKLGLGG